MLYSRAGSVLSVSVVKARLTIQTLPSSFKALQIPANCQLLPGMKAQPLLPHPPPNTSSLIPHEQTAVESV